MLQLVIEPDGPGADEFLSELRGRIEIFFRDRPALGKNAKVEPVSDGQSQPAGATAFLIVFGTSTTITAVALIARQLSALRGVEIKMKQLPAPNTADRDDPI